MINHHPSISLLEKFVQGELPATLAAGVSIHAEMCSECRAKIYELTEQSSEAFFEMSEQQSNGNEFDDIRLEGKCLDDMIDSITNSDEIDLVVESKEKSISVNGEDYVLPRALTNMTMGKWSSIGKIARSRLDLNEGDLRASLLQIKAGGQVPEHTHKGFELTLLLDGHFKDDLGEYGPGDFIMLDGQHTHSPITDNGCLCYTVSNDAQHFTQGINKLLNPFGSFIY
jgi:putative transcriptional regulator